METWRRFTLALLGGMLALLVLKVGCTPAQTPLTVIIWTWSDGPRRDALLELIERFDRNQVDLEVKVAPWSRGARSSRQILELLEPTKGSSEAPALIEVPEEALPALVEGELTRDVGGRFAEQLGVNFDDFLPELLPARRVASEGVIALPLFQDVPLIAWKRGAVSKAQWRQRGFETLLESEVEPEGEEGRSPVRPLAAAADYRLFLALLASDGDRLIDDQGAPSLDRAAALRAYQRALKLLGGRAFPAGADGERQAREALVRGEARAAWLWSSELNQLGGEGYDVVRAPARTRGTWLVVHAGASWRERQAAFRLSRWLTEPLQVSELAARFWMSPIRRSAA